MKKWVYKVWEKNYNRPTLRHCATVGMNGYEAFSPMGTYEKGVTTPLFNGGRRPIDLAIFMEYPGVDAFERFKTKVTRKGVTVRGETVNFKLLGILETVE